MTFTPLGFRPLTQKQGVEQLQAFPDIERSYFLKKILKL
jgi:hypothetical protein